MFPFLSIESFLFKQELKLVEPYLAKYKAKGFGNNDFKNIFVETVYKSRFSEYPKECKIFRDYKKERLQICSLNLLSICHRTKPLFVKNHP